MDTCVFHSGDAYLIEQSSSIYPSSQVHSQGRLCCRWRLIIVHTCVYRECYWLWQHRCSRCSRWLDSRMYKRMPSIIEGLGMAAGRCPPEAGKSWKVRTWQTVGTRGILLRGRVGGINQRKSNNSVLLASEPGEKQLRATVRCPPEVGKYWKVQTWQTVETRGLLLRGRVGGINQRKSNNSVLLASEPAEQQLRATVRCPPEAGKTWKVQTWQTVETRGLLLRDHVGSAIKT